MQDLISVSDLHVINDEPRVLDLRLAEALGFERPRKIREIIERNRHELESFGTLAPRRRAQLRANGARHLVTEYHLNEPQALIVCMFSRTARAADVRRLLVEVFMAWRQGKTVPVKAHHRRPPARRWVDTELFCGWRGNGMCHIEMEVPDWFAEQVLDLYHRAPGQIARNC
ncbi:hypothetical protein GGR16_002635 [Chelatococcus caeni]|uniref:Uncharacterized protein n=1 Tax=Chelatococcus caeni TaxID=1348468 RepID=A0A840BVS8_9HYPH|nr:hypothetical protein [Chelatococcus caeni]MBB4017601.1 hypothetical protein [Chelatococcus caeni]